jgi:membrane associated rhomboid family serine protease
MENDLSMRDSIILASCFALVLWVVKACEVMLGQSLHGLGVFPQTASGLFGIIAAPFIHGSWQHLLSNTVPILLLGSMLLYGYPRSRWWVLLVVWVVSGVGVWLFARESYHIGASGLSHGMFFFLFVAGILRRDKRSIALLMVAFFMYGAMFWTIFPQEPGISFEYHLFGALAGTVCALAFGYRDPKPERKVYDWEHEEELPEEDDPIIGDQWKIVRPESGAREASGQDDSPWR